MPGCLTWCLRWQPRRKSHSGGAAEFSEDVIYLRGLGGGPRRDVKDLHESHPSGSRDSRSSWKRKFKVLRPPPRGLQTFGSRHIL